MLQVSSKTPPRKPLALYYHGMKVRMEGDAEFNLPTWCYDDIKDAIRRLPQWRPGRLVIHVRPLPMLVVSLDPHERRLVTWAYYTGHHGRYVRSSPFIERKRVPTTELATVELGVGNDKPRLVRAYPGDEWIPLLPWQHDSWEYRDESIRFWRRHAIAIRPGRVRPNSGTMQPPDWFVA